MIYLNLLIVDHLLVGLCWLLLALILWVQEAIAPLVVAVRLKAALLVILRRTRVLLIQALALLQPLGLLGVNPSTIGGLFRGRRFLGRALFGGLLRGGHVRLPLRGSAQVQGKGSVGAGHQPAV